MAAVSGIFAFRAPVRTTWWPQPPPRPARPAAPASPTRTASCSSNRTRPRRPAPGRRRWRDQRAGLVPVHADRGPRRRADLQSSICGDPAGSAEGFEAADFGRGPALPNRLSQALGHQPTNARFCRIEDVAHSATYASFGILIHGSVGPVSPWQRFAVRFPGFRPCGLLVSVWPLATETAVGRSRARSRGAFPRWHVRASL